MSVRRAISEREGIYFITITNCSWLPLFELADGYEAVYQRFDVLKSSRHYILGYVIMPNHLHCLIAFSHTGGKSINSIVVNGKRFMAYDLISRLKGKQADVLLAKLATYVNQTDNKKGKLHEVFEPSFDCKRSYSAAFIEQKLNYMHENPCRGKWSLAENPADYKHSSARYYLMGTHSVYEVHDFQKLSDIDLTKSHAESV